jgi:hypothetical protein
VNLLADFGLVLQQKPGSGCAQRLLLRFLPRSYHGVDVRRNRKQRSATNVSGGLPPDLTSLLACVALCG